MLCFLIVYLLRKAKMKVKYGSVFLSVYSYGLGKLMRFIL